MMNFSVSRVVIIQTKILLLCLLSLFTFNTFAANSSYKSSIQPIPTRFKQKMNNNTWHEGCPLSMSYLSYVTVSYWGYDGKTHRGVLIVNNRIAKEVTEIFKRIYAVHFPIKQIKPMYLYHGDDLASMKDNNTTAFNCREVTGRPNVFSAHSYGTAIDINPLVNPYVKDGTVLPPAGKAYINRQLQAGGMIKKNDAVYKIFKKYGWTWGGDWHSLKDYQHFEKKW